MTNVVGIIGEYNPFHNGHEYHLEKLSKAIEKAADVDNALNVIIKFEI